MVTEVQPLVKKHMLEDYPYECKQECCWESQDCRPCDSLAQMPLFTSTAAGALSAATSLFCSVMGRMSNNSEMVEFTIAPLACGAFFSTAPLLYACFSKYKWVAPYKDHNRDLNATAHCVADFSLRVGAISLGVDVLSFILYKTY